MSVLHLPDPKLATENNLAKIGGIYSPWKWKNIQLQTKGDSEKNSLITLSLYYFPGFLAIFSQCVLF